MNNEYLLEMRGICKSFPGVQALKDVSLNVKPGEVHAIMGENGAGKSTLMKCLFGLYSIDAGEIRFEGEPVSFSGPLDALKRGISMVQQELDQVPERNVMENVFLGRYPRRGPFIDEQRMYLDTLEVLKHLSIPVNPRDITGKLSVSVRQLIEIAKAISYGSKVIVLDEPTSSLTEVETKLLFDAIRRLTADGCGVIYISHKLGEVFEICDRVTVLRDGMFVTCKDVKDVTADQIIAAMVNRPLTNRYPPKANRRGEVVLRVENLSSYYPPQVKNVSFELRAGEILGISGLVGSRRTELVETIFGYRRKTGGRIVYKGKELTFRHTSGAIRHGFSLVTEERRASGFFPMLNIRENTIIASLLKCMNRLGFLHNSRAAAITKQSIDALNIKTPSQRTLIRDLSGGNQQKVILGRWLLTGPDVLLLDEPTRGIDVGAKYEIYQLMINLAVEGKAVIFVSSEMPELLGVADRILVMSNGQMAGIVDAAEATQE